MTGNINPRVDGRRVARIRWPSPIVLATLAAVIFCYPFVNTRADDAAETVSVTVVAREFHFHPGAIRIRPGQRVSLTLQNQGVLSHNLEIPDLDLVTETIQPQQSATVAFIAGPAGELVFQCKVPGHEQAGMRGKFIIAGQP